jgi:hypothetical protein
MEGRTDSVVTPSAPLSLELEFQQASRWTLPTAAGKQF